MGAVDMFSTHGMVKQSHEEEKEVLAASSSSSSLPSVAENLSAATVAVRSGDSTTEGDTEVFFTKGGGGETSMTAEDVSDAYLRVLMGRFSKSPQTHQNKQQQQQREKQHHDNEQQGELNLEQSSLLDEAHPNMPGSSSVTAAQGATQGAAEESTGLSSAVSATSNKDPPPASLSYYSEVARSIANGEVRDCCSGMKTQFFF